MAEQEGSHNGPIKAAEEPDVSPPDSLNGDVAEPVEVVQEQVATLPEEKPVVISPLPSAPEVKAEGTLVEASPAAVESVVPAEAESTPEAVTKMEDCQESAIDREVRLTLEREEQLKEEHSQKLSEPVSEVPSDATFQPQDVPDVEIISASGAAEVSAVAAVETPTSDVVTPAPTAEQEGVDPKTPPEIPQTPPPPAKEELDLVEPNPEPVEPLTSKPQIIGETYHHVTKPSSPTTNKVPPVVLKNSIPSPTERTFKAESKIAIEIQEMRQREEELKRMREKAVVDNTIKPPSESNQSEVSSVHSDDSLGQSPPESLTKDNVPVHQVSRTISLDSVPNGQAYNMGYAYGRKDNVKVKPFVDPQESDDERPKFRSQKETPIEREIRIAREREEELRKQNGLQGEAEPAESLVRPTSLGIGKSRTSSIKPVGDTQRILATSRIQQEIEEQTEREKAMRASGMIQTISQERTDSRVSRIVELTNGDSKSHEKTLPTPITITPDKTIPSQGNNTHDKTPLSPASTISDKSASSVVNGTKPTTPIVSNVNDDKLASPVLNNMNGDKPSSPVLNGTSSPVNGKMNGSVKTPSPSNSTVSSSPLKANSAGRRFSNPPPGRGVNMQRFISSKGKDVAFKTFNGNGVEKSTSLVALNNELYELKPPQIPVQNKINQRRSVAMAGPRIQEELKEMQEREEELKKQRARMLGLSQPNLSTLGTEEDMVTNGHEEKPTLDRSSSIPNLLENGENGENGHSAEEKEDKPSTGTRRRSTLIDQWEQRIQKLETKS